MSFSTDVRNELARIVAEKECCRKAELAALLINKAVLNKDSQNYILHVETDNPATARKIYKYIKEIYNFQSSVKMIDKNQFKKRRNYLVNTIIPFSKLDRLEEIAKIRDDELKPQFTNIATKNCCKRAYLRGLFLNRGFINRPEGTYHLELVVNDFKLASELKKVLNKFGLEIKLTERKKNIVLYLKESDQIADFLRIIGANQALLEFENVRILKSMRNSVNRQVNCETANLAKTIDASIRQIELIKKLLSQKSLESLPYQLRELAVLRIDNPDSTLKELGEMLNPPLSKSGVAYRMRRLEKIAEELLEDS